MKLCSLLLLVVVSSGTYIDNEIYHAPQINYLCQQWCYRYDNYGAIFLTCCDMTARHGNCPKGCIFGYGANIRQLLCQKDGNCPMGYKCCPDSCSYFQTICKPIVFQTVCEAPPNPPPPVTTQTPHKPHTCPTNKPPITTEGFDEITTTESYSGELPTVVYSGSGDDDDDYDEDWEVVTKVRDEVTETTIVEITTKAEEETTIHEEETKTTLKVDEQITIPEEPVVTSLKAEEETTIPEEPVVTTLEAEEETTIPEEPVVTTLKAEEETTIPEEPVVTTLKPEEEEQPEMTTKPEEKTTTLDPFNGSGSGSGSGDGDDEIVLPPVADQPYDDDDDDFYYERL